MEDQQRVGVWTCIGHEVYFLVKNAHRPISQVFKDCMPQQWWSECYCRLSIISMVAVGLLVLNVMDFNEYDVIIQNPSEFEKVTGQRLEANETVLLRTSQSKLGWPLSAVTITRIPGGRHRDVHWGMTGIDAAFCIVLVYFLHIACKFACIAIICRVMDRRLRNRRCVRCNYSLLGLPLDDVAACPECGLLIGLVQSRLLQRRCIRSRKKGSRAFKGVQGESSSPLKN